MSNLLKRVMTALVLLVFIVGIIFINRTLLILGLVTISNIAIYELLNALKKINYNTKHYLAYLFNTVFLVSIEFLAFEYIFPIFTIYMICLFIFIVLDENFNFNEMLANAFVAIYVSFPYAFLLLLKNPKWVFYAFAIPAATDTFAYFFGMFFGKHKLIERLSPKKTVEGAIGGVIGGIAFTFLFIHLFNLNHSLVAYLASIGFSIVSQIGDLFASYIKRIANIKDYGNILIGHGGIMDRFDSLLLVAPLVYILVNYLR